MAPKYEQNDRLLVDREELARLCAKAESTIRNWLRQGIIERANPAAPHDQKALFDLAVCLPRILSYVGEKRALTPGLPTKTARALATMTDAVEIQKMLTGEVREALGELRGFRQKDIAARRRQRVKGNGAGREVEASG